MLQGGPQEVMEVAMDTALAIDGTLSFSSWYHYGAPWAHLRQHMSSACGWGNISSARVEPICISISFIYNPIIDLFMDVFYTLINDLW